MPVALVIRKFVKKKERAQLLFKISSYFLFRYIFRVPMLDICSLDETRIAKIFINVKECSWYDTTTHRRMQSTGHSMKHCFLMLIVTSDPTREDGHKSIIVLSAINVINKMRRDIIHQRTQLIKGNSLGRHYTFITPPPGP